MYPNDSLDVFRWLDLIRQAFQRAERFFRVQAVLCYEPEHSAWSVWSLCSYLGQSGFHTQTTLFSWKTLARIDNDDECRDGAAPREPRHPAPAASRPPCVSSPSAAECYSVAGPAGPPRETPAAAPQNWPCGVGACDFTCYYKDGPTSILLKSLVTLLYHRVFLF